MLWHPTITYQKIIQKENTVENPWLNHTILKERMSIL